MFRDDCLRCSLFVKKKEEEDSFLRAEIDEVRNSELRCEPRLLSRSPTGPTSHGEKNKMTVGGDAIARSPAVPHYQFVFINLRCPPIVKQSLMGVY